MPKDCEKEEEEVEAKATPTHLNRGTVDKQTYQSYIKCFFNFIQLCNLVQLWCWRRKPSSNPSFPGLHDTVVKNSDSNKEAGQSTAEVTHVPDCDYLIKAKRNSGMTKNHHLSLYPVEVVTSARWL